MSTYVEDEFRGPNGEDVHRMNTGCLGGCASAAEHDAYARTLAQRFEKRKMKDESGQYPARCSVDGAGVAVGRVYECRHYACHGCGSAVAEGQGAWCGPCLMRNTPGDAPARATGEAPGGPPSGPERPESKSQQIAENLDRAHRAAARLWPVGGVAQAWPPAFDPANAAHVEMLAAANCWPPEHGQHLAEVWRSRDRPTAEAWARLARAALAFAGLAPGLTSWEKTRAELDAAEQRARAWALEKGVEEQRRKDAENRELDTARELDAARAEIRRLTAGLREAETRRDEWKEEARGWEAKATAAEATAATLKTLAQDMRWEKPTPPEPELYREAPVTRRVRLELVGAVESVRPDGKGRGMEITLQGTVQLPLVDDSGPWVRALPPVAGAPDRGRWRVVKWRRGTQNGDVIVDGLATAVVYGDTLWLEVPADG